MEDAGRKKAKLTLIGLAVAVAVLGAGGWFLFDRYEEYQALNRIRVQKFGGILQAVEGEELIVRGNYVLGEALREEDAQERTLRIKTSGTTLIRKEAFYFPTPEEAERLGGSYRLSDLKREEAPGSVSDLAALLSQTSNIWVNAEFDANIYGRDAVPASRIFYRVGLEPVSNENESEL